MRVERPGKIAAIGLNYLDHIREAELEPPPKPLVFAKFPSSVIGDGEPIRIPRAQTERVDWEVELAVVIGERMRDVDPDAALDYVAGYTVANELSARDLGRRNQLPDSTPFKWDWVGQKCFDDACPIGPWIVPASDIKDPQKLGIKLWVNDVIKQDSNTSDMIFNLAEQLSHLSSRITLYPGDIILTGTPAGVGAARREFLKAGDTTRVWVENVGELVNKMA